MLVDSHCHLDFPDLAGDLEGVMALMRENQVTHALCVSVTLEDFPKVLAIAEQYPHIFASVGVHPDYEGVSEPTPATLVQLAQNPKVVAIGETGLDYYRVKGDLDWQRERFRNHIRAAKLCGKPLIIHTREAAQDTMRIMREEGADSAGGVMHCFTETWEVAQLALDLGFHISFSGIVTFKNALALKEVAKRVPLERMLIETDSPYLAPAPFRGKMNQPGLVKYVAAEIARLRNQSVDQIAEVTTDNFSRLFRVNKDILNAIT
ncbi:MAG: TatD family hydrolase [Burkholderiales bacterium]|nr:TatD family hydrolase [Burkholderiales bacterium]